MQDLAEGMSILAGQLDRLKETPKSDELCITINEFPAMMEEVVDFIEKWLESWSGVYSASCAGVMAELLVTAKHVLVVPHKDKAIELRKKLDTFAGNFDRDLLIEIRAEQGLIFVPDIQCPDRLIHGISNHGEQCQDRSQRRENFTDQHCKYSRWVVCLFLIDFCNMSFVYQKLPMLPKSVLTVFKVCYLRFLFSNPRDTHLRTSKRKNSR